MGDPPSSRLEMMKEPPPISGPTAFGASCGNPFADSLWGLQTPCETTCRAAQCDWTCPNKPAQFVYRWREVGGWPPNPPGPIRHPAAAELPLYVPVIQHGKWRGGHLNVAIAAVPTFRAVKGRANGTYGLLSHGPAELREEFHLAPQTQVLFTSVAQDKVLENYWRRGMRSGLEAEIAALDLLAMTVPNYSFHADAPPTHTEWNRERMLRVAEELSAAGSAVVLHLNAITEQDWRVWEEVLRAMPEARYIAKEFGTGLARREKGLRALNALCRLQDSLQRELHPLIIGGARYVQECGRAFRCFTVIDSQPFMAAEHRRLLTWCGGRRPRWVKQDRKPEDPIDEILELNISRYAHWLEQRRQGGRPGRKLAPLPIPADRVKQLGFPQFEEISAKLELVPG